MIVSEAKEPKKMEEWPEKEQPEASEIKEIKNTTGTIWIRMGICIIIMITALVTTKVETLSFVQRQIQIQLLKERSMDDLWIIADKLERFVMQYDSEQ